MPTPKPTPIAMRLRNTLLIGLWALSCGTGARADALVEELDLKAAYVFNLSSSSNGPRTKPLPAATGAFVFRPSAP